MQKIISGLFILFVFIGFKSQAQTYWQQQVNFNINVSLNDVNHTLQGFEKIEYINNSPDTLKFIWFHVWPNAYKNDKTAFSEQMIRSDNTEFYFSKNDEKGYINRLDFKINNITAETEDHPEFVDVIKLKLNIPLAPGKTAIISTPFFVKLPKNFSRGGHFGQSYQITQWYPKPAMYDETGWHPMPYLDQGEFYNNFGDYEVKITLPTNYEIAATGSLQNTDELSWLKKRTSPPIIEKAKGPKDIFAKKVVGDKFPPSDNKTKELTYKAKNVTDFAWFADKRFIVKYDTILVENRVVDVWNFVQPNQAEYWKNSIHFTKNAISYFSSELGPYPYEQVSVVCAPNENGNDGMEYPMVTLLSMLSNLEQNLDVLIEHEVGHNWLQAIIANNERDFPWMDEGMNTFYERKYQRSKYPPEEPTNWVDKKAPRNKLEQMLNSQYENKQDQPIQTTSEAFTTINYGAIAYEKAGIWMEKLEAELGKETMKKVMQAYFKKWGFKHPKTTDFKQVAEEVSGKILTEIFDLLNQKRSLEKKNEKRKTVLTGIMNFRDTEKKKYIGLAPAIGTNNYNGNMVGLLLHNYNLPNNNFQFVIAPMISTKSKSAAIIGRLGYKFYPKQKFYKGEVAINFSSFKTNKGIAEDYTTLYNGFTKIVPSLYLEFKPNSIINPLKKWVDLKLFSIIENQFDYKQRRLPQDTNSFYAFKAANKHSLINQLRFGLEKEQALYPWKTIFAIQQIKGLIKSTVEANYFLNYNALPNYGVSARLYAGKILYVGNNSDKIRNDNYRYDFSLYAFNGEDDYTYSNPFIERNQSQTFAGRQIMIANGGFKYRSDYSGVKPGRTNDWLAAVNLGFDIPKKINPLAGLPLSVPLRWFVDVGTSAPGWVENTAEPRFLYSMGLQLSVFNVVNFYYVVLQSKQFKEPNSLNGDKGWQKRMTFSIDLQNIKPKVFGQLLY